MGLPVSVVLPPDLVPPPNPEEIRGAKEWLRSKEQAPYSENIDQPAFTTMFDLDQARTNSSFDKCCREVRRFMGSSR